ncbi:alginate export family protein [Teredinibacter turnerae]|uniref:alginate export family protein n=1 Tax=Teredinibacter turnerae TaxID=2426 RepID=UPI00036C980A
MNSKFTLIAASVIAATGAQATYAESALETLMKESKTGLDLRYRYEFVDQDGIENSADASTLRTRLTFESGKVRAVSFKLEMDDSRPIGPANYNSTRNGKSDYPVVADPKGTDLNQAFVKVENGGLSVMGGRQRILLDDQRFVGGVGWRQNEQTYDGARLTYKNGGFALDTSYILNVNRIFGPEGSNADWRGDIGLLNGAYSFNSNHKLTGFYYSLDFEDAIANSSNTLGVRYSGKFGPVNLTASYATQEDTGDNPTDYSADYYLVDVGGALPANFKWNLGYEVLGSDDGTKAFSTPLATLHKFQGWDDKFLNTPNTGIQDTYVGFGGKPGGINFQVTYHTYSSDVGSVDYGTELDAVMAIPVNKQTKVVLKYANYSADDFATDTSKYWAMIQFTL